MKGSMRKRGDTWELRAGGVSRTFRGSERQAQTALARLVIEVEERRTVPSRGRTVAMLGRRWLEVKTPTWTPKVVKENARFLERELLPALGAKPLTQLRTEHIDAFYASLRRRGNSPATIARKHNTVRSMLEQGARWGWVGVNPARYATKPPVPPVKSTPPNPATVAHLLSYAAERYTSLYTFILLAADTGARRGQLLALRWEDFDAGAGTISFTKTKGVGGEVRALSRTKGRSRTVQLAGSTVHTMSLQAGVGFVFSDDDGRTSWPIPTFQNRWVRLRRAAGVTEVNFHQLRHYVATQLIGAGVDVRTVADRLGHSRTSTTLDMYAAPLPEKGKMAADLLERILHEADMNSEKGHT